MRNKLYKSLHRMLHEERGAETLQVLAIIAVAGVSLIAVKLWWGWYAEYLKTAVEIFVEN